MRIEPSNPPSSRPTACKSVDLPEPDGPSKATISPGCTARLTLRRTSIVTPPWVKLRFRPRVSSTGSFIAKHLDRVGVGSAPRREQCGEIGQHQSHGNNRRHL